MNVPFCPEYKTSPQEKLSDKMIELKRNENTENKKLISDWTDKKDCLYLYRMLKLFRLTWNDR